MFLQHTSPVQRHLDRGGDRGFGHYPAEVCPRPPRVAASGRTWRSHRGPASDRNRRNLVVPARSGEGLLTILIADLRHRAVQPGGLLDAPPLSRNKARSAESNSDQSQQILLGACRA